VLLVSCAALAWHQHSSPAGSASPLGLRKKFYSPLLPRVPPQVLLAPCPHALGAEARLVESFEGVDRCMVRTLHYPKVHYTPVKSSTVH